MGLREVGICTGKRKENIPGRGVEDPPAICDHKAMSGPVMNVGARLLRSYRDILRIWTL